MPWESIPLSVKKRFSSAEKNIRREFIQKELLWTEKPVGSNRPDHEQNVVGVIGIILRR